MADIWARTNFQVDIRTVFAVSVSKWTCPNGRVLEVFMCGSCACAARKPQGRAALIKQTQCTTQFCIQVGCPSPRRWFPRTIDRYYLGVQWTSSKSLRYLYLFGFLSSFLSDTLSFHNGFSCSPISSRSFHDRVDSSADFNVVLDSDASISIFHDRIVRKNWEEYKSIEKKNIRAMCNNNKIIIF